MKDQRAKDILNLITKNDQNTLAKYLARLAAQFVNKYPYPLDTANNEFKRDLILAQMLEYWFDDYYFESQKTRRKDVLASSLPQDKKEKLLTLISLLHTYMIEILEPSEIVDFTTTKQKLLLELSQVQDRG
jgi:hypothetical protein